jgi:hypothetical protein
MVATTVFSGSIVAATMDTWWSGRMMEMIGQWLIAVRHRRALTTG